MTENQANRISMLTRALAQWPHFEKELRRDKPRYSRNERRAVELSIGDMEEGEGVQPDSYVYVDHATGRMIAKAALKIILDELKKLGVQL